MLTRDQPLRPRPAKDKNKALSSRQIFSTGKQQLKLSKNLREIYYCSYYDYCYSYHHHYNSNYYYYY